MMIFICSSIVVLFSLLFFILLLLFIRENAYNFIIVTSSIYNKIQQTVTLLALLIQYCNNIRSDITIIKKKKILKIPFRNKKKKKTRAPF